jgi:hypothetical protein
MAPASERVAGIPPSSAYPGPWPPRRHTKGRPPTRVRTSRNVIKESVESVGGRLPHQARLAFPDGTVMTKRFRARW